MRLSIRRGVEIIDAGGRRSSSRTADSAQAAAAARLHGHRAAGERFRGGETDVLGERQTGADELALCANINWVTYHVTACCYL